MKVKGIYLSAHVAGNEEKMQEMIQKIDETEINAVVIDVKDDNGRITFQMDQPLVEETGAVEAFIPDIQGLMDTLKEHNIYTIARVVSFRDPYLAEKKPELALKLADGRLTISAVTIVTIITCIVIMVGLTAFINKTRIGQAMLAVSEDTGAATLMGINVNKTISITFAIGSALAAIAGALLCSAYPSLTPYTGAMPGIKAFVAAVFGGIGSIPGALIGGVILGVIENLTKAYISSQLSDAVVFSVLIIVLLVRPTGILGKKITEKV